MGATVPIDGYISNAARTTGEVKSDLDDIIAVLVRMIAAAPRLGRGSLSTGSVHSGSCGFFQMVRL